MQEGIHVRIIGDTEHFRRSTLAQILQQVSWTVCSNNACGRQHIDIAWNPWDEMTLPAFQHFAINAKAKAGKKLVAEFFSHVFGRPFPVNPLTHAGLILAKSDHQATHDGEILQGPIQASDLREGKVYQRLVNNTTDDEHEVIDIRVPIIGDAMPVAWLKWRSVDNRFGIQSDRAEPADPSELFSFEESWRLRMLCRKLQLDYGELDVLRDRDTHQIYVVDANPTPYPLVSGMPRKQWNGVVSRMADSVHEAFHWRVSIK